MSAELQMNSLSVAQNTPAGNRGGASHSGTDIGTPAQISRVTSAADYLEIAECYLHKATMELVMDRDLFPAKALGGYLRLVNGTRNKTKALRKLAAKLKGGK